MCATPRRGGGMGVRGRLPALKWAAALAALFTVPVLVHADPGRSGPEGICSSGRAVTWAGTTSSQWSDSTNWQGGTVPEERSTVCVPVDVAHAPEFTEDDGQATITAIETQSAMTISG